MTPTDGRLTALEKSAREMWARLEKLEAGEPPPEGDFIDALILRLDTLEEQANQSAAQYDVRTSSLANRVAALEDRMNQPRRFTSGDVEHWLIEHGNSITLLTATIDALESRLSVAEAAVDDMQDFPGYETTIGPEKPAESLTELPIVPPVNAPAGAPLPWSSSDAQVTWPPKQSDVPEPPLPGKVAGLAAQWAQRARAKQDLAVTLGPTAGGFNAAVEGRQLQECANELNRLL